MKSRETIRLRNATAGQEVEGRGLRKQSKTGRVKDKARLLQFVEAGVLDPAHFQTILSQHELVAAWQSFEQQFLRDKQ